MAVLTVYTHGVTAGTPPTKKNHKPPLRSTVGGWSPNSIRSNTKFLYSIDETKLSGVGLAITLTVGTCPDTAKDFHAVRRAWFKRMQRRGLIRAHWVIEWQRRGVPHLHIAAWFEKGFSPAYDAIMEWSDLTHSRYGSKSRGQHTQKIKDALGWFQYVSKHASRGLSHYQRSPENVPPEWNGKTGRIWGYVGDWPDRPTYRFDLSQPAFWMYRRIMRRRRLSDARAALQQAYKPQALKTALRRVTQARTMLSCTDRHLSEVRGISEWAEFSDQVRLLSFLVSAGFDIGH